MSLYNNHDSETYEKIIEEIKFIILNKTMSKVNITNLNINDMVYVCFYPNSQK